MSVKASLNFYKMSRNSGHRNHNREENKKLANLVEQYPQLYDRDHVLYGKTNAVDQAWKKIGKMWGKPVPECKERWRNIRAAYARSIDAYKTKRGPNRGRQYYLAKEMEFLKPNLLKEVAQINDQNNGFNNSKACANENDVHYMNHIDTFETFSAVMPLIDGMDEQNLRDLQQIIERKLRQIVAVESNNDNELSAPMQQLPIQAIKEEPELSI